ncbi:TPA: hypothetical protein ACH3X2_007502 [Trebouxia sp. C0005]
MICSSDEDEDKAPTAFAKQVYILLDNDRQSVDRDSKYTAFWLAHGMTLSSQYRIGQHGDWQLKFEDPSTDHPNGKFICEACEAAAERDWDPCEEYHRRRDAEAERLEAEDCWNEHRGEEDTEEGGSEEGDDDDNDEGKEEVEKLEDWEGVADVHHLRQHAATRQHILNMQYLRRACKNFKMDTISITLSFMSKLYNDCMKSRYWMGSDLGMDQVADLLQSFQVGNAGVAQVIARYEAKRKRQHKNGHASEPYDSDDEYPHIAEREEWYPFHRAARKVPQPKCGVCWGHHPLSLCCCGKAATERQSAFSRDTKLGTCERKICRAAAQKTGRLKWTYSFEAGYSLFAMPQPVHTADRKLCKGVAGNNLPVLQPGRPGDHASAYALEIFNKMGDSIKTRPAFADMFFKADDKLAFVQRVRPYVYVSVTDGVRSSFCSGVPAEPSDLCPCCKKLQDIVSS